MLKQGLRIDGRRLQQTLETFAEFGCTPNNGVSRLALSEEDRQARDYFLLCCEELGMTVKVDDIGNMYGTLPGKNMKHPPVVIGSHLDAVEKGGRFDGALGVTAGLEVARTFIENKIEPQVPLIVANFTNEEGARFEPSMMASGILSGKFNQLKMMQKRDSNGISFDEALRKIGYAGDKKNRLTQAAAFIELHIEQGPVLEQESIAIGAVEAVAGMVCYEIKVTGESNHAGTTPMSMRNDALFSTNHLMVEIRKKLSELDQELVYTMGRVNVHPNIHTVIPDQVVFTLEARHQDPNTMRQVERIVESLPESNHKDGCGVKVRKLWDRDTVYFDKVIVNKIEKSAASLGYSTKRMVSGAGHDAQFLASYIPTAMIFVPSVKGKSHCEEELTWSTDCERGANVLLRTVLNLGYS